MRFINDDVKLKVGGRSAAPISEAELEEMMLKTAQRHNDELSDAELPLEEMDLYYVVQALHHWVINKDNKFNVDGENVIVPDDEYDDDEFEDIGESLLGFHTLQNGLTFFGYMAGGDWESPVFMIIYYDGKKLRGYTPSYGNAVHLDCKCAFGSGDCEMSKIPVYRKKYGNFNAWKEPETNWEIQNVLRNCYLEKYDMYPHDDNYIPVNFDAMKQDIESRIVVDKKSRQNLAPSDKSFSAPTSDQETNGYNNLPSALVGMLILFGEFMERCKINPDKKVTLKLPLSNGACSYLSREKDNKLYLTGFVPEELRPTVDEAGKIISAEAKVIMAAFSEIIVDFEIIVE